jgi:hypothetical protein
MANALLDRIDSGRATDLPYAFAVVAADSSDVDLAHTRASGVGDRVGEWRPDLGDFRTGFDTSSLGIPDVLKRSLLFRSSFPIGGSSGFQSFGHVRHDPIYPKAVDSEPFGLLSLTMMPHGLRLLTLSKTAPTGGCTPIEALTEHLTRGARPVKNGINTLTRDGDAVAHRVGQVVVVMTVIRPDASYRVAVQHGSTGAEVPELTANYATEALARRAARNACLAFAAGQSVTEILGRAVAPVALVERTTLVREVGPAGLIRITAPQYRLLAACLTAGSDELVRGDGEASVTTLRALAQFGAVDLVTDRHSNVIGARVTGFGWRALSAETARRAGKPSPQFVPVPVAALASAGVGPQLRLVAA